MLSYLKVIVNPRDELSFKRALSIHRGIGRKYAHRIWEKYSIKKEPLEDIAKSLPDKQKQGFRSFSSLIARIKETKLPDEAIRIILQTYSDYCKASFDNPQDRISDIEELAKMAHTFPTIRRFILDLSSYESFKGETVLSGQDKEQILVLSTIHQAKGLEWEAVFIIGFSDYEFPHPKALNSQDSMEEERRLFYVAVTRAKSILYITYPQNKYTFKNGLIISRPSIFLDELPEESYEEWSVYNPPSSQSLLEEMDDFYI
jgi:DNA helicase-2/ATP-dependent DNA helicase PcrA